MIRFSRVWLLGVCLGCGCATPEPSPSADPERDSWLTLAGVPDGDAARFGGRLLRPVPLETNAPITFPREAAEQQVEGLMVVKGVITADGQFTQLKVLKALPVVTDHVLAILGTWRFTPAMVEGRPIAIKYVVPIRLKARAGRPDAGTS